MPAPQPPAFLLEDSYLARSPLAAQVWGEVCAGLPERLLPALAECVFVLIKPDALAAHKHEDVWTALARMNLRVLHVRACIDVHPGRFENLYRFNLTAHNETNMLSEWWMASRVYTMGPSIALLVHVPSTVRGTKTAHAAFAALKGPSDPYRCEPCHLRGRLSGTNLALNLVHASDDPLCTAREFVLFDSAAALADALGQVSGRRESQRCIRRRFTEAVELAAYPRYDVDFVRTLVRLKMRLRALHPDPDYRAATEATYDRYDELLRTDGDLMRRWQQYRAIARTEFEATSSAFPDRHDEPHRTLTRLAAPADFGYELAAAAVAEARRMRIHVDPWEELILESTMFYSGRLPAGC